MHSNNSLTYDWIEEMKSYEKNKKKSPDIKSPYIITRKEIMAKERIYNPITQSFLDIEQENNVKSQERKNIVNTVIKSKDKALRNEHIYDLINLSNKLKGFENHPNFPKEIATHKKKIEAKPFYNYNIISNISLDKHHYDKPENRPNIISENSPNKKLYSAANHDYNNVYNIYIDNHNKKLDIEKEIALYQAAQKYITRNSYDPIKIQYADESKIYKSKSPFGKKVFPDKAKLSNDIDYKWDERKKRYKIKEEYENFKNLENISKLDNSKPLKRSFEKNDNFNIINLQDSPNLNVHNKGWEKLTKNSNNNSLERNLYKDIYDNSDSFLLKQQFLNERKDKLHKYKENNIFEISPIRRKEDNYIEYNYDKSLLFDKEKWFNNQKDINYKN